MTVRRGLSCVQRTDDNFVSTLRRVNRLLPALAVLLVCSACGSSSEPTILPHDQVDVSAWQSDLADLGAPDARIENLGRLAREDCKTTVDDLELRFTLVDASPETVRLGFKYVCPKLLPRVDKAIAETESLKRQIETLCSSSRDEVSPNKKDEYDAVCVD